MSGRRLCVSEWMELTGRAYSTIRRAVLAGKNMETVLDGAWRSEGHG